jgi:hypothetical protein
MPIREERCDAHDYHATGNVLITVNADIVAPGFVGHLIPWIQLPALIGEGALCLWLLVVGVDVGRWQERARAAIRTGPLRGRHAHDSHRPPQA